MFINTWFLKSPLLNILSSVYPLVDYSNDFVIGYAFVSLVEAIYIEHIWQVKIVVI